MNVVAFFELLQVLMGRVKALNRMKGPIPNVEPLYLFITEMLWSQVPYSMMLRVLPVAVGIASGCPAKHAHAILPADKEICPQRTTLSGVRKCTHEPVVKIIEFHTPGHAALSHHPTGRSKSCVASLAFGQLPSARQA